MVNPETEFLISQHADGVLDPARADEVEALLNRDSEARAAWLAHRRLGQVLKAGTAPPALDWDRVAESISSHIAEAEAEAREQAYRLPVGRWAVRVAAVAAVLAIGVFVRRAGESVAPVTPLARVMQVAVAAPTETAPAGRVMQVSIGAPPADTPGNFDLLATEDRVAPRPRIVVAAGPHRPQTDPFDGY